MDTPQDQSSELKAPLFLLCVGKLSLEVRFGGVPERLCERAFFSANVTNATFLHRAKNLVAEITDGRAQ